MNQEFPFENHQQDNHILRSIGRYMVGSLIRSGDCTVMRLSCTNTQPITPITEIEIENFAWRIHTADFDQALNRLVKEST